MNVNSSAYGLWGVVALNIVVFVLFILTLYRPRTARDWRSFGAFTAFIIALFTEMYGFPLTIYLLSGWLLSKYPGLDLFTHDAGHLWQTLLGWKGDPHFDLLHILSGLILGGGIVLIAFAWGVLYGAQRDHDIATTGLYARIRHPQYVGFVLILIGFLLEWPTIITLLMFPILVFMYLRLARREEKESLAEFGERYAAYMAQVPAFIPHLTRRQDPIVSSVLVPQIQVPDGPREVLK
jgi:protein-S-isoprenylcysteine O-methyltransferase Ste14